MHSHRIILPPGCHLYLSQHPKTYRSFPHTLTPLRLCLLHPHHTSRISNAPPLPLPKYILTYQSAAFWPTFANTTAPGASILPRNLSLCCRPPILNTTPPTLSLLPASFQYKLIGTGLLPSQGPSLLPPSARSCPSVAPPSIPLSSLRNPHVPPTSSWTWPLTKPRSPPQKVGLTGPPPNKTWRTLVAPPPPSGAASSAGSRPCGTYRDTPQVLKSIHPLYSLRVVFSCEDERQPITLDRDCDILSLPPHLRVPVTPLRPLVFG